MRPHATVSVLALLISLISGGAWAHEQTPRIDRLFPLGAQRGTTIALEFFGHNLANTQHVEFDSTDLVWLETTHTGGGRVAGKVCVADAAALGQHMVRLRSLDGCSTAAMFNVGQFPCPVEVEPNDNIRNAQPVTVDVEIQGWMFPAADVDMYSIEARKGERCVMDLRSIEHGSVLECKLALLNAHGRRIAWNDDRNDYDETPFLEHTFESAGTFYIVLDRYRGSRGGRIVENSVYTLRLSRLPTIQYATPLGARVGHTTVVELHGTGMDQIEAAWISEVRAAGYMRMTYPYTMPIRFGGDPENAATTARIAGTVVRRSTDTAAVEFAVPDGERTGLWRLWVRSPQGIAEGTHFELTDTPEFAESQVDSADWQNGAYTVNGNLSRERERDEYQIQGLAGTPLHFWTLSTQLGIPHLDPVLTLYDADGTLLAENDDTVAAYGTLIGNPDSSLFYTPAKDGPLRLTVRDRSARGGPSYCYRLKVDNRRPAFQLFTTPENFAVERGGEGSIKVLMPREGGFNGEVMVWFENLPEGIPAPRGTFRRDQTFEPNADGAEMIIPEIVFTIQVPKRVLAGTYPLRLLGAKSSEPNESGQTIIQGNTCAQMGPILDLWNWVRRPLPEITLTVVDPVNASLSALTPVLTVKPGASASLDLKASNLPRDAEIQLKDVPPGISWKVSGRHDDQIAIQIQAAAEARPGQYKVSAESQLAGRWVTSDVISLAIQKPNSRAVYD